MKYTIIGTRGWVKVKTLRIGEDMMMTRFSSNWFFPIGLWSRRIRWWAGGHRRFCRLFGSAPFATVKLTLWRLSYRSIRIPGRFVFIAAGHPVDVSFLRLFGDSVRLKQTRSHFVSQSTPIPTAIQYIRDAQCHQRCHATILVWDSYSLAQQILPELKSHQRQQIYITSRHVVSTDWL